MIHRLILALAVATPIPAALMAQETPAAAPAAEAPVLSRLTYDAASVFVHFGPDQTQTWLLVRLPSPEMPLGAVKLPEIKKPAPAETK